MNKKKIAVLITCHNRKLKTLECISNVYSQEKIEGYHLQVYLVDDGSTDGTVEAIQKDFKGVKIIKGDGTLFWNRGMNLAFKEAKQGEYDFYLLLNDDTFLYKNAICHLLRDYYSIRKDSKNIIVGTVKDPNSKKATYGGYKRTSKINPLKFALIEPSSTSVKECDTMNGNVVLIPREVEEVVGNLDPSFSHRMGDTDYALRAKKLGCYVWISTGYVGECERNEIKGTSSDYSLSIKQRFKKQVSEKGSPPKEWLLFSRRHGGFIWILIWMRPYIKVLYKRAR